MDIGPYTFEAFIEKATDFHGYPAPGLVVGGYMVELAKSRLPDGTLFEALVETPKCLPDAVQLLTLCSVGNGRLKIINWGLYALTLYDKFTGVGFRVYLDPARLERWPELKAWYLKQKPKKDQNSERLLDEIRVAGPHICGISPVRVSDRFLRKSHMGPVGICPVCAEAYPSADGAICRKCQGEGTYFQAEGDDRLFERPPLEPVPLEEAVGKRTLHDMTRIVPGQSKGAAYSAGQKLKVGDICRLQRMGRNQVFVQEACPAGEEWVHENDAAGNFAKAMAGEGITYGLPPKEGKVDFTALRTGLLSLEEKTLERFNLVPNVMCATRQNHTLVEEGKALAGCRALPLYLNRRYYEEAMSVLQDGPLLRVIPLRKASVGILVTGTEVFQGLVDDKFIPVIKSKAEALDCRVVGTHIVPDDRAAISNGVSQLIQAGADLIITTAGLSVDPDDVTLQGLMDAGAQDLLYGAPVLPGAMTLLGCIGKAQLMGVPACALFFKTTALDLLLPRMLAGVEITRHDLARMAEGGFCLNCRSCTFPKCPFGK